MICNKSLVKPSSQCEKTIRLDPAHEIAKTESLGNEWNSLNGKDLLFCKIIMYIMYEFKTCGCTMVKKPRTKVPWWDYGQLSCQLANSFTVGGTCFATHGIDSLRPCKKWVRDPCRQTWSQWMSCTWIKGCEKHGLMTQHWRLFSGTWIHSKVDDWLYCTERRHIGA